MTETTQRDIGNLTARVVTLEASMVSISDDLKAIRSRTDRASGFVMLVLLCVPTGLAVVATWLFSR